MKKRTRPQSTARRQPPERFRALFTATNVNLEEGTFEGMASVFGSPVDTWIPTLVDPGAFTQTLKEDADRVKILWQHDDWQPIGKPVVMQERANGLYVQGRISQTTVGKDCLTLMRDGVITELSIGFDPVVWEMVPDPNDPGGEGIRHLKQVRLWEFSPVTWAADSQALIASVHSRFTAGLRPDLAACIVQSLEHHASFTDEEKSTVQKICAALLAMMAAKAPEEEQPQGDDAAKTDEEKAAARLARLDAALGLIAPDTLGASGAAGLALAARDRPWDAPAADTRVRKWASKDGSGDKDTVSWAKYGQAFLWTDSAANPKTFGSFKLPFADVIDGHLMAVPRGIFAVAQRLDATEIPADDKTAIQGKLSSYYAAMRKKFGDPNIIPPWEGEKQAARVYRRTTFGAVTVLPSQVVDPDAGDASADADMGDMEDTAPGCVAECVEALADLLAGVTLPDDVKADVEALVGKLTPLIADAAPAPAPMMPMPMDGDAAERLAEMQHRLRLMALETASA